MPCRPRTEKQNLAIAALPLVSGANELEMLRASLPDRKVLLSMPANAKEYLS